ncbi:MAG: prolipoprotein diacylglyceryl transferase, partial [Oscillospiraceae bacterium]|nr:prolipoprotein diacylglyceryl transferase [Oscillospiraceae bacterium]
LYFVILRLRRFDGEITCCYFLWYGLGRFWIEGLSTDSLYLFDLMLFGQRVRVSQALSLVLVLISAGILFCQLRVRRVSADGLWVNRKGAAQEDHPIP